MNREGKIAERMARSLVADHGDVPIYFNVFDIFKVPEQGRSEIEKKLSSFILDMAMNNYQMFARSVIRDLKGNSELKKLMLAEGVTFKV